MALRFQFTFTPTPYSQQVALNLGNLPQLLSLSDGSAVSHLLGVTSLLDTTGQADFSVQAGGSLIVNLGIDLSSDPASPQPFLYDTSQLKLQAKGTATNMNFSASLAGIVGVFVENGEAALSADGTTSGGLGDSPSASTVPTAVITSIKGPCRSPPASRAAWAGTATLRPHGLVPGRRQHGTRLLSQRHYDPGQSVLHQDPQPLRSSPRPRNSVIIATPNLSSLIPSIASFASNVSATGSMLAEGMGALFERVARPHVDLLFQSAAAHRKPDSQCDSERPRILQ